MKLRRTINFLFLGVVALVKASSFEDWELFKIQDQARLDYLLEPISSSAGKNFKHMKEKIHRISSQPLMSACKTSKFFGGKWADKCGATEGAKNVCLDHFLKDGMKINDT